MRNAIQMADQLRRVNEEIRRVNDEIRRVNEEIRRTNDEIRKSNEEVRKTAETETTEGGRETKGETRVVSRSCRRISFRQPHSQCLSARLRIRFCYGL